MARNILVIGHSHIHALRLAAIQRREDDPDAPRTRTINLLDPKFGSEMADGRFSPGLSAAILDQVRRHDPIIASAIGGNAHAAFAMIPRIRFDFETEGGDTLPIDEHAIIRSEADVRGALAEHLNPEIIRLRLLRELAGPFWQIESPPPIRRADWIVAHAEPYFTAQPDFHRLGIAGAGVRYRTWLLASRIISEECARLGCHYVEVPHETRGEAGLLRPSMARDATHGNIHFGEAMLRALEWAAAQGGHEKKPVSPASPPADGFPSPRHPTRRN